MWGSAADIPYERETRRAGGRHASFCMGGESPPLRGEERAGRTAPHGI